MQQSICLGYLKYHGLLVEDGLLDAKKAAEALLGFDETIRYFLFVEKPVLKELEFEIPVVIQKGSWVTWIPDNIDILCLKAIATWGVSKYVGSALNEMAKNDFKDLGLKELFKSSFRSIMWVMRIAVHVGSMKKTKFENVKFRDNNDTIGIPNYNNEYLFVPKKYYDLYVKCPEALFSRITNPIEEERELEIGLVDEPEMKVNIVHQQKEIFYKQEDNDEPVVFPEFQHGDYIEIEGYVTRGNESTNSIGFEYKKHILTCKPVRGSIVDYKTELFSTCLIRGTIDRTDKFGKYIEKKPRINFDSLVNKTSDSKQDIGLFD